ncbi:MAG: cytochrome c oxidase assembly factor CtaG [Thermicanus sp.]|nr:cytochrome c oxidase assembly factor CtaG [Thermicanus sp.]
MNMTLWYNLQTFGFIALWNPNKIVLVLIVAGLYLLLTGPFRKDIPGATEVPLGKKLTFMSGLLFYYVAEGSPFYLMSHIIFTLHMAKMAVIYLIVPPLLLLGSPKWFYEYLLKPKFLRSAIRFFTRPLLALLWFNGLFSIYHLPAVLDALNADVNLNALYGIILFLAAIFMWWPILSPLGETDQLSELRKIAYIVANGVLITPACALITFADSELYQSFTNPQAWAAMIGFCLPTGVTVDMTLVTAKFFRILPPLQDQQLGGVVMKIMQEIIYGIFLGYVFYQWVKKEREKERLDLPSLPGKDKK